MLLLKIRAHDSSCKPLLQRRNRNSQCNPVPSSSEESVPAGPVSQPSLLASCGFSAGAAWWLNNQHSPRLHLCGLLGVIFSFVLRFVALLRRGFWHAEIAVAPSQKLLYGPHTLPGKCNPEKCSLDSHNYIVFLPICGKVWGVLSLNSQGFQF